MAKVGATSPGKEMEIAKRAYAIWESEGRPDGHHLDHWLRAESEVGKKPAARKPQARKAASPRKPRTKVM